MLLCAECLLTAATSYSYDLFDQDNFPGRNFQQNLFPK